MLQWLSLQVVHICLGYIIVNWATLEHYIIIHISPLLHLSSFKRIVSKNVEWNCTYFWTSSTLLVSEVRTLSGFIFSFRPLLSMCIVDLSDVRCVSSLSCHKHARKFPSGWRCRCLLNGIQCWQGLTEPLSLPLSSSSLLTGLQSIWLYIPQMSVLAKHSERIRVTNQGHSRFNLRSVDLKNVLWVACDKTAVIPWKAEHRIC